MNNLGLIIIYTFLFSFTFGSIQSKAQTPYNFNFENWFEADTTPELWHDTLIVENRVGLFPPNWHFDPNHIPEGRGLGRTTDATSGDYAVALSGYYQYFKMRIITGNDPHNPGWPIDFKPSSLEGDYKAILLGNCDSLITTIKVQLKSYNAIIEKSEVIAETTINLKETETYKPFKLDINYFKNLKPDTIIVELSKQRYGTDTPPNCLECSHVFFDNLKLNRSTAVNRTDENPLKIEVHPNPTTNYLDVNIDNFTDPLNFKIFNSNGQLVNQQNILKAKKRIDFAALPSGIYLLCITNDNHTILTSKKIIKQ